MLLNARCSYKAVTRGDIVATVPAFGSLNPLEGALVSGCCWQAGKNVENITNTSFSSWPQVDYCLAMRSQQFAGNSVSMFSALVIMERWHVRSFATYYNGGNIPLEAVMPLYQ